MTEPRLIVQQVVKVQDVSMSDEASQWLKEQGGEQFINRIETPVHLKTYLFWLERDQFNKQWLWVGFYENKFAMMFKLIFGCGVHVG